MIRWVWRASQISVKVLSSAYFWPVRSTLSMKSFWVWGDWQTPLSTEPVSGSFEGKLPPQNAQTSSQVSGNRESPDSLWRNMKNKFGVQVWGTESQNRHPAV